MYGDDGLGSELCPLLSGCLFLSSSGVSKYPSSTLFFRQFERFTVLFSRVCCSEAIFSEAKVAVKQDEEGVPTIPIFTFTIFTLLDSENHLSSLNVQIKKSKV